MSCRLSAKKAREVIEGATLVKAPEWRESKNWQVIDADGTVLVIIEASYSGTRRNGWTWWLAHGARMRNTPQPTREQAAVAGLGAWERWVTTTP